MTTRADEFGPDAKEVCRERCALYGDPPCWTLDEFTGECLSDENCEVLADVATRRLRDENERLRAALDALSNAVELYESAVTPAGEAIKTIDKARKQARAALEGDDG